MFVRNFIRASRKIPQSRSYIVAAPKSRPLTPPMENEYQEVAWGWTDPKGKCTPLMINRPKVTDYDVKLDIDYCGVCHSDVSIATNYVGGCTYPIVPGHEMVGTVVEVGKKVSKVKIGDKAGIGVMSDACLQCPSCDAGHEQYCHGGKHVATYNDLKRYTHIGGNPESQTFGGFSGSNVLNEHFVMKIPEGMPMIQAGPILCAGLTMYDPLKYHGATEKKGMTIGVVGIGGLGSIGVKIAKALGHTVVAISTKHEAEMAMKRGADHFICSTDKEAMEKNKMSIDLILNTIPAAHQVMDYMNLLNFNGTIVQLGLVPEPHQVIQLPILRYRWSLTGSHIGGIKATEEVLQLCAEHNILPETEVVTANQLDWVWEQLDHNKSGVRYVLDIKKSLENKEFLP